MYLFPATPLVPRRTAGAVALLGAFLLPACGPNREEDSGSAPPVAPQSQSETTAQLASVPAGVARDALGVALHDPNQACMDCHQDIAKEWQGSDHAFANRVFNMETFGHQFGDVSIHDSTAEGTRAGVDQEGAYLLTKGASGELEKARPDMVLAHHPLNQLLIPFPGGRWQVTEVAWDTINHEWFNVYGYENREPHEWGYWTNRGMVWNAQCAVCHTTEYDKGYDLATDTYASTWTAHGITCIQCHGRMEKHSANPEAPVLADEKLDAAGHFQTCLSCHSRREELTVQSVSGELYTDHYRLQLPVEDHLYYADGQIKDEVFVAASFLSSAMGDAGVQCRDCHNPHTGKTLVPAENNLLCLQCHAPPGRMGATMIDLATHSNHQSGSTGDMCVSCHMPETNYMVRDPRRDHGFHSPNPALTISHGIPNACNRCHADQTPEWAANWVQDWYGEVNEDRRERTLQVDAAYHGNGDPARLVELARSESNAIWKAALIDLATRAELSPRIQSLATEALAHPHPLVRSVATRTLQNFPDSDLAIRPLLDDPSRLVRIDAAWALQAESRMDRKAFAELRTYTDLHSDQPGGAMNQAQWAMTKGDFSSAEKWLKKAAEWDASSPLPLQNLGLFYNSRGRQQEALQAFTLAATRDPGNPTADYYAALIYAEQGQLDNAEARLTKALAADPEFARARYNLSLLQAQQMRVDDALTSMQRALEVEPENPEFLYAQATLLLRAGRQEDAIQTLQKAVAVAPEFTAAQQLLMQVQAQ